MVSIERYQNIEPPLTDIENEILNTKSFQAIWLLCTLEMSLGRISLLDSLSQVESQGLRVAAAATDKFIKATSRDTLAHGTVQLNQLQELAKESETKEQFADQLHTLLGSSEAALPDVYNQIRDAISALFVEFGPLTQPVELLNALFNNLETPIPTDFSTTARQALSIAIKAAADDKFLVISTPIRIGEELHKKVTKHYFDWKAALGDPQDKKTFDTRYRRYTYPLKQLIDKNTLGVFGEYKQDGQRYNYIGAVLCLKACIDGEDLIKIAKEFPTRLGYQPLATILKLRDYIIGQENDRTYKSKPEADFYEQAKQLIDQTRKANSPDSSSVSKQSNDDKPPQANVEVVNLIMHPIEREEIIMWPEHLPVTKAEITFCVKQVIADIIKSAQQSNKKISLQPDHLYPVGAVEANFLFNAHNLLGPLKDYVEADAFTAERRPKFKLVKIDLAKVLWHYHDKGNHFNFRLDKSAIADTIESILKNARAQLLDRSEELS